MGTASEAFDPARPEVLALREAVLAAAARGLRPAQRRARNRNPRFVQPTPQKRAASSLAGALRTIAAEAEPFTPGDLLAEWQRHSPLYAAETMRAARRVRDLLDALLDTAAAGEVAR